MARRIGDLAAIVAGLIGLAALLEYVFDVSFGIDELVSGDSLGGDSRGGCRPRRRSR